MYKSVNFKSYSMLKSLRAGVIVLAGFAFWAGPVNGQAEPAFNLKAYIKDMPDGMPVYLVLGKDTVDEAVAEKGKFEFSGSVEGDANFYFFFITLNGGMVFSNALWLENKPLKVDGEMKEFSKLKLNGSVSQHEYESLKKIEEENKNNDSVVISEFKAFVKRHPESLYAPYMLTNMMKDYSGEDLVAAYNRLAKTSRQSFYGKQLGKLIDRRIKYKDFFEKGPVGTIIPDFTFTTVDGEVKSLHDVISKNKYTLLDYWASWCKPCRAGIPEMKRVHEDFKEKGLGILGVSIDQRKADWMKAMKEDKTNWMHGWDNINNSGKEIFEMAAIPGYILVDNTGKIISADYVSKAFLTGKGNGAAKEKGLMSDLYGTISAILTK